MLLDARAAPRYRGEIEPVDPIAGHIPTAVQRADRRQPRPDGRFRPAGELRGPTSRPSAPAAGRPGRDLVRQRHLGAHHSLAMRVAGLPDPILYVGSYSDWSRSGDPIATGAEPGEPPEPGAEPSADSR